jgi:hypothetical protein
LNPVSSEPGCAWSPDIQAPRMSGSVNPIRREREHEVFITSMFWLRTVEA